MNSTVPIQINTPFVVVNDEVVYQSYCEGERSCVISTRNVTVSSDYVYGHFIFSQPNNLLLYSNGMSVRGYEYPSWNQKVWYEVDNPNLFGSDTFVVGNNCTSYIAFWDYTTQTANFYALRELPLQPLIPIVDCVKNQGNGTYTVYLSYNNQQSTAVRIPFSVTMRNQFINSDQYQFSQVSDF
jgi:hypothetical protein